MKTFALALLAAGTFVTFHAFAMAPADAPAGTMGICNDGTYSSSAEKKGACRGHKGVKEWYSEAGMATAPAKSERAAVPPPSPSTTSEAAKPASPAATTRTSAMPSEAAAGGGPGKVWVNTSTKVYHCSGDKYYGKTKHGDYMSESDAKSKGYRADHGKACS